MYKWYFRYFNNSYVKKKLVIITIFILMSSIINSFAPFILKKLIDKELINPNINELIIYTISLSIIFLLKYIFSRSISYYGHKYGLYVEKKLRNDTFSKLMSLDIQYFNNTKNGNISSIITNEATNIAEFSFHFYQMGLDSILSLIVGIFVMSTISLQLTVILFIFILLTQIYTVYLSRKQKEIFKSINQEVANLNGNVNETLSNILLVKTNNSEQIIQNGFNDANNIFVEKYLLAYKILSKFISWSRLCINMYNLLIIVVGSYLMINNIINVSTLISFLLFISFLTKPINSFISTFDMYISASANIFKLYSVSLMENEIIKNEKTIFTNGDITFDNISYAYDEKNIINNLSLNIIKNSRIGIVGPTGSGKTTLINLLQRNININSGNIYIDNNNINDIKWDSYKQNISVISQNAQVLNTTIRNNITFNQNVDEKSLWEAIKFANLEDFVNSHADGLDHIISEDATNLSGGQKQRISIARAILKNSQIIIFDEATSALDNKTEREIQNNIDKISTDKTIIIIAHRLTTVKNVDEIIVLKEGNIIEKGSHDILLDKKGYYYELVKEDK